MPKVRLRCNQRVRYDQTITLSENEAKGLRRVWNAVDNKRYSHEAEVKLTTYVDGLIDHADVEDGDDLEDIEIEFLKEK